MIKLSLPLPFLFNRFWTRGRLPLLLVALSLALVACGAEPPPTPTPTRTPRPPTPTRQATPAAGAPVTDWRGEIYSLGHNEPYDDFFRRENNQREYGILAQNAAIREIMNSVRDSGQPVIISGILFVNANDVESRRIVISSIRVDVTDTPTPPLEVATPTGLPTLPPTPAPPTPTLAPTPTPLPTPSRTPTRASMPTPPSLQATPTPIVISDWQGDYFGNPNLTGSPVLIRNDTAINFDWSFGPPAPGLPADAFSVRWIGGFSFNAGDYRFQAYADDGVRVFLDDMLLINEWHGWVDQIYQADFRGLSIGRHTVRVEYVDTGGAARVWVRWNPLVAPPTPSALWQGEYFNTTPPNTNPVLTRLDPQVAFDWGLGSPDPSIAANNFSARWTRSVYLEMGSYRFSVRSDDGVRVWLDNTLVINDWSDGVRELSAPVDNVANGYHWVRVEYYERVDRAFIQLSWTPLVQPPR